MDNIITGPGNIPMMPHAVYASWTDEQKISLESILSKYDPENFTKQDFESLGQELHAAGIRPSLQLRTVLEEAGFDVKQYAPAPQENNPQKLSFVQNINNINSKALQSLYDILGKYDLGNLSKEDEQSLLGQLTNTGIFKSGSLVNIFV